MKTTVTMTQAQGNWSRLLKRLPREKAVTITNHGKVAGYLISKDRMKSIIETMEILANRNAMKAIRYYEAGRCRGKDISVLDE